MNDRITSVDVGPEVVSLTDLRGRMVFRPEEITRLDIDLLKTQVRDHHKQDLGTLVLELTARHPYDAAGYADYFHPGRWDCETDLIYMGSIYQVGATPGEWDGTVGYLRFTAPAAGTYIVVINFSGYQQTMSLNGPWGTSTAHSNTTSDSAAVTALWTATQGQALYATYSAKADNGYAGIAYFDSLQIYTP